MTGVMCIDIRNPVEGGKLSDATVESPKLLQWDYIFPVCYAMHSFEREARPETPVEGRCTGEAL
jgi:hypothetical protein